MNSQFDLSEFMFVAEKKVDSLIPGKVYELSYERPGPEVKVKVSRTYYCLSVETNGWRVLAENKFSDWSDFDELLTRESTRKFHPDADMHAIGTKSLVEMGIRDSKTFIKNCIKSPVIREKFGFPPVERKPKAAAPIKKKRSKP